MHRHWVLYCQPPTFSELKDEKVSNTTTPGWECLEYVQAESKAWSQLSLWITRLFFPIHSIMGEEAWHHEMRLNERINSDVICKPARMVAGVH